MTPEPKEGASRYQPYLVQPRRGVSSYTVFHGRAGTKPIGTVTRRVGGYWSATTPNKRTMKLAFDTRRSAVQALVIQAFGEPDGVEDWRD